MIAITRPNHQVSAQQEETNRKWRRHLPQESVRFLEEQLRPPALLVAAHNHGCDRRTTNNPYQSHTGWPFPSIDRAGIQQSFLWVTRVFQRRVLQVQPTSWILTCSRSIPRCVL